MRGTGHLHFPLPPFQPRMEGAEGALFLNGLTSTSAFQANPRNGPHEPQPMESHPGIAPLPRGHIPFRLSGLIRLFMQSHFTYQINSETTSRLPRPRGGYLRRAWRRSEVYLVLPQDRSELRLLVEAMGGWLVRVKKGGIRFRMPPFNSANWGLAPASGIPFYPLCPGKNP